MRGVFRASRMSGCSSSSLKLVAYVWLELFRGALSFRMVLSVPYTAAEHATVGKCAGERR